MIPDNAPEKARELLDGADPGPWEVDRDDAWEPAVWSPDKPAVWSPGKPAVWSPDGIVFGPYRDREGMEQWEAGSHANLRLAAAAPTLAAIVAGMHTEYAVSLSDGTPVGVGWGDYDTALEDMNAWRQDGYDAHIVRRYVTGQEKIT